MKAALQWNSKFLLAHLNPKEVTKIMSEHGHMEPHKKNHIETVQMEEGNEQGNFSLLKWCEKSDEKKLNFLIFKLLREKQLRLHNLVDDAMTKVTDGYITFQVRTTHFN